MINLSLKKIIFILPIIGILGTFAINYNEYFPNGSTIIQSTNSGWVSPVSGGSKEIITPEGCKKITGAGAAKLFIPTRNSDEWNTFKNTAASNNITISACTYYCPAKVADGYSLAQGAENEVAIKSKTIANGSCNRTFQCDKTSTMWIPTTDPSCICNGGYIWNGSACVTQNQTKTMSCAGVIPANGRATGNSTYTSSSTDGGITWSPGQLSWYAAGVTSGAETFNSPSGKLGANKLGNNDPTADRYCKELGFNNGGVILSGDDFYSCDDNSISWWGGTNWRWQWACSNNSFINQLTCSWTKGAPEGNNCEFVCNTGYTWKESTKTCSAVSQIFDSPRKTDLFPSSDSIAAYSPATRIKWCQEKGYDKGKVLATDTFYSCSDNNISYYNGTSWQNPNACSVDVKLQKIECSQGLKGYTWEGPFEDRGYGGMNDSDGSYIWNPGFSMSIGFYKDTTTEWTTQSCDEGGCVDIPHTKVMRCSTAKCTDSNGNIVGDGMCTGVKPNDNGSCACISGEC